MSQSRREADEAFKEVELEESGEFSTSDDEEGLSKGCLGGIRTLTKSYGFQALVGGVILLNVFQMAFQADYPGPYTFACSNFRLDVWMVVSCVFLLFFTLELACRFLTYGCRNFFCNAQHDKDNSTAWNWFDFAVVAMSWLDVVFIFAIRGHGSQFVTMVRTIRICRIMRVGRVFKATNLRLLLRGFLESFDIAVWVAGLMIVIIFILAIFCTNVIGQESYLWNKEDKAKIEMYWGTVPSSMQTLYQYLTLDDWGNVSRLVAKQMPHMMLVFVMYVIVAAFVVLSLLTGVMAEHINAVRQAQEAEDKIEKKKKLKEAVRVFYKVFGRADLLHDGRLVRAEFEQVFKDRELVAQLANFDVNLASLGASDLFEVLDVDDTYSITWDEFRSGMIQLRDAVTPKQVIELRNRISRVLEEVQADRNAGRSIQHQAPTSQVFEDALKTINMKLSSAQDNADVFEYNLDSFLELLDPDYE